MLFCVVFCCCFPSKKPSQIQDQRGKYSGWGKAPSFGVFLLPSDHTACVLCIHVSEGNGWCQPCLGGAEAPGSVATLAGSGGSSRRTCSIREETSPVKYTLSDRPTIVGLPSPSLLLFTLRLSRFNNGLIGGQKASTSVGIEVL